MCAVGHDGDVLLSVCVCARGILYTIDLAYKMMRGSKKYTICIVLYCQRRAGKETDETHS